MLKNVFPSEHAFQAHESRREAELRLPHTRPSTTSRDSSQLLGLVAPFGTYNCVGSQLARDITFISVRQARFVIAELLQNMANKAL